MCRIKFFLISGENKSTHAMTRQRKIENNEQNTILVLFLAI